MFFENKLINSFSIKNCIYGSILSKELLSLKIEIPNIQRITDDEKIEDIIKYQKDYLKKHNKFNIIGVINIHYCKQNETYYLTDGQHRYQAIKRLYENMAHNIELAIECIKVESYEEVKANFNIINKNTQLPEFPDNIDKNIPEMTAMHFKNIYPSIWSKTSRSRRPHIYFNFFQEALGFLTLKLKITNSNDLINIIENFNSKLSNWDISSFPDYKNIKKDMFDKCKNINFYLGLYKHCSDESGYKWCRDIIHNETGEIVKEQKKSKKNKIPKSIKNNSWDTYIGKTIGEALCLCCNINTIDSKTFTGGHIISDKNGGEINVNNIIPICSGCNLSMGSKNMDIFIKEFYPENIKNFNNKKYSIPTKNKSWNLFG